METNQRPIGVFDSGIGGLTIAKHIHAQLPQEDILFLADHANVPYGEKSLEELVEITEAAIPTLIAEGAKTVVIACNTASVSIVDRLRQRYPDTPFVAVVPMIKPAAQETATGVVAVFATEITLNSAVYGQLKRDHAAHIEVVDIPCPEWVHMIESGHIEAMVLQKRVSEALAAGADQLVLGCTHFPFVIDDLRPMVRGRAALLESGPAVARQVSRILTENEHLAEGTGRITYLTSGSHPTPSAVAQKLTGWNVQFQPVGS
jgi:glutamate racemase